ncbi:hypothetical protein MOQ_007092 [Trypanosoma cruzi marinkellei]|uniref:Tectonic-1-3 N-terminal domain-containing protein n=1 Tax=Trypanosoma cruzi marinkellei TaxID=85056 RepID=K2MTZ0_TRYCR|nr:hypothetical protein MOQ_007092 [Trypanosoma cruzi marinkellei]
MEELFFPPLFFFFKVTMQVLQHIILCSVLLPALLWANAENPVSYPIDWESSSSTITDSRDLESSYLGECVCDMTLGCCDPNCCCDTDCTVEEKQKFLFCLQETVGSSSLDYCYEKKQEEKAIRSPQRYLDRASVGSRALCLVRSNNLEDLNSFFALPKEVPKPREKKSVDWAERKESSGYEVNGDLLLMKRIEVVKSLYEMRSMGVFRIPAGSRDGYCNPEGRRVRFMDPIDTTACVLPGERVCALFPTSIYANLFFVSPGYSSYEDFTPIQLRIFNHTSGKLLAEVDSNSSIPEVYSSVINGDFCENGVVRVHTVLFYKSNDNGLLLIGATTDLYINNINRETIFPMLFQIKFSRSVAAIKLNYFSGTPGYFEGSRLRAGTLVEKNGKAAILERVSGFSVPSGGRSCYKNKYRNVGFLHDILSSGCTIVVSEVELRDICSGGGTAKILRSILSINVEHSSDFDGQTKPIEYVARTNDALTNDTTSWIKIDGMNFTDITPDPYNPVKRECSNIYVGLHYSFVLSRVGAESNPQDIIVAAFTDPIIGSWRIRNTRNFGESATSTQYFRFSVSFKWIDSDLQKKHRRRVIAPPILPRLDETVLYPFKAPG